MINYVSKMDIDKKDYVAMLKKLTELYNMNNGEKIIYHLLGMFMAKLYLNTSKSYDPVIGPDKNTIYKLGLNIFTKINEDLGLLDIKLATDYIYKYCNYFRNIMYHEYFLHANINNSFGFCNLLDCGEILDVDLFNALKDEVFVLRCIETYNSIIKGIKYLKSDYKSIINGSI